jgi:hypothetical protein
VKEWEFLYKFHNSKIIHGLKKPKDFMKSFFSDNFLIYNSKTEWNDLRILLIKFNSLNNHESSTFIICKYLLKKINSKRNGDLSKLFGDLNVDSFYETILEDILKGLKIHRGSINIKQFNNFVDL